MNKLPLINNLMQERNKHKQAMGDEIAVQNCSLRELPQLKQNWISQ